MAKNRLIFVSLFMVALLTIGALINPVTSQENSKEQDVIYQRLLSDMRSLRQQISQINSTVNNLQQTVSRLENKTQRQKNRINELEEKLETKKSSGESTSTQDSVESNSKQASSPQKRTKSDEKSVWVDHPNHDYKIRRTPLDHETTFTTTDDTTLTELAHRYYRNSSYWRQIYEINKDKLPSPGVVPPKLELRLPPLSDLRKN